MSFVCARFTFPLKCFFNSISVYYHGRRDTFLTPQHWANKRPVSCNFLFDAQVRQVLETNHLRIEYDLRIAQLRPCRQNAMREVGAIDKIRPLPWRPGHHKRTQYGASYANFWLDVSFLFPPLAETLPLLTFLYLCFCSGEWWDKTLYLLRATIYCRYSETFTPLFGALICKSAVF